MLVVIGTDCIDSCKSNYHTITSMMAPPFFFKVIWDSSLLTEMICELSPFIKLNKGDNKIIYIC
jgi:hypothetical protein